MYWSITTMTSIGYGDIFPQTTIEKIATIILMLLASGIYALIINDVSQIVNNFNRLAADYKYFYCFKAIRERSYYVNYFLKSKDVPQNLKNKIRNYLEYHWELKKEVKIDESEVMELLNDDLRK